MSDTAGMRLVVFTRFPAPGAAKTRLIPVLGAAGAAALQRRLTQATLEVAGAAAVRCGCEVEVRYTGADAAAMRAWLGDGLRYREQGGGDLGERMRRAVEEALGAGAGSVLLLGSDIHALEVGHLAQAFARTADHDLVLGPAHDGGYYLLGLTRPAPRLFERMAWGTDTVLQATLERAREMGMRAYLLPALHDIDRPGDLALLA